MTTLATMLSVAAGGLALMVLVPAAVLFVQVLLAIAPAPARGSPVEKRPRIAVLIPAHDEAEGIAATLAAIRPQLASGDRLLVVADNCTDATARVAAAAGAEVTERTDPARRGKGHALAHGVDYLRQAPPEVVIVVDADCLLHPGGLEIIAGRAAETSRPVQCLDLMQAPHGSGVAGRIAEFAWVVKNQVRTLGSHRLGLPCLLMGTGMAFPWPQICDAHLGNAELAEDMKLGIDLARSGHPPLFCPDARVTSRFPSSVHAVATQRARWEHGHLGVIARELPRLVAQGVAHGEWRLVGLALDLAVPPLALLAALIVPALAGSLALLWLGLAVFPVLLAAAAAALLLLAVLLAWHGWGRAILPLIELLSVPAYVLGKLPLYLKFWTRRQKDWVRTGRDRPPSRL